MTIITKRIKFKNKKQKCSKENQIGHVKETVKEKRTDRELKIIHWNANGIVGKIVELSQLIAIEHPDVVSINETKTNTTTCAYLYNIRGYFPYIKNRDGNGGGVALLIKENLISESIKLPENISTIEAVGALLKLVKNTYRYSHIIIHLKITP